MRARRTDLPAGAGLRSLAAILLLFSATLTALPAHAGALPGWVEAPPETPGYVAAVGIAPLGESEARAVNAAGSAAKVEVVTMLRSRVQGRSDSASSLRVQEDGKSATAQAVRTMTQESTISAQARDLVGLRVAETYIDRENRSVYALARLDLALARSDLDRRQAQLAAQLQTLAASRAGIADIAVVAAAQRNLGEFDTLLELAGLLAAWLGNEPVVQARQLHEEYIVLLKDVQQHITFGVGAGGADVHELSALMSAVTEAGYAWTGSPRYRLDVSGAGEPRSNNAYGRLVLKSGMDVRLLDEDGSVLRSARIQAVGAGATHAQARANLDNHIKQQITDIVGQWLRGEAEGEPELSGQAGTLTPGSSDKPFSW